MDSELENGLDRDTVGPAIDGRKACRVRLPVQLDSFVGREAETARGLELLGPGPGGVRMVTLVGPGGVGKTRLAIRLAAQLADRGDFPDDVALVSLIGVADRSLSVVRRLLQVLGVPDNDDEVAAHAALADRLAGRDMLLIIDNCEHVSETVREVLPTLFGASPGLRVLTTSRDYLELPGEHLLVVPPLPNHATTVDGAVSAAVQLLIDRAAARDAHIDPADPDAAMLCGPALLDGSPADIELAAGCLDVLTLRGIVEKLGADPLAMLKPMGRSRHRSQRTIRDVSYNLLDTNERRLWAVLAVFRGHFHPEMAEHVCERLGFDRDDVATGVATLVQRSILVREMCRGHRRVRMQEPVRRYGLGLVLEDLSQSRISAAHAEYFAERARQAATEWYGPGELDWMRELGQDSPNIDAAVEYLLSGPDTVAAGLQMVVNLAHTRVDIFDGQLREARARIGAALDAHARFHPGVTTPTQVSAVALGAWLGYLQGRSDTGQALLGQARELQTAVGGPPPHALVLAEGSALWLVGERSQETDAVEALDLAAEIAACSATRGEQSMAALFATMATAFGGGDHATAITRAHDYLAVTEKTGAEWAISWALFAVAVTEHGHGQSNRSIAALRRALTMQQRMGDSWGAAWSVWLAGVIAASSRESGTAAQLLGAARTMRRGIGTDIGGLHPWLRMENAAMAVCLAHLGPDVLRQHTEGGQKLSLDKAVESGLSLLASLSTGEPLEHPGGLTNREQQAVELLANNMKDRKIAEVMGVSVRTVETHLANARKKLQVNDRTALLEAWRNLANPS
ncbi:non-specific serine/threonine protein kinase [Actinokineospora cianjurensis]|uniref:Non-specific serine/threonine protein kinase n=2 Tax=Actinokineospora cianjurensis TaxID=585224 RepID=A0A421AX63_9PSEU|nr:non-specific serine/threonine protein kinase [Actinokineospora cianjurensis]